MIRVIILLALGLSSTTLGPATAGFAGENATETAATCTRHVQKLALVAPELICLHPVPKAASRPKSVA